MRLPFKLCSAWPLGQKKSQVSLWFTTRAGSTKAPSLITMLLHLRRIGWRGSAARSLVYEWYPKIVCLEHDDPAEGFWLALMLDSRKTVLFYLVSSWPLLVCSFSCWHLRHVLLCSNAFYVVYNQNNVWIGISQFKSVFPTRPGPCFPPRIPCRLVKVDGQSGSGSELLQFMEESQKIALDLEILIYDWNLADLSSLFAFKFGFEGYLDCEARQRARSCIMSKYMWKGFSLWIGANLSHFD